VPRAALRKEEEDVPGLDTDSLGNQTGDKCGKEWLKELDREKRGNEKRAGCVKKTELC